MPSVLSLLKMIRRVKPTHVAVVFDGDCTNDRCDLDEDYKANRPDYSQMPQEETPFCQLPDIYDASFSLPECGYSCLCGKKDAEVCLISSGAMTGVALEAAKAFPECRVIDMIDMDADLSGELKACKKIFTLEEGIVGRGGLDAVIRSQVPHVFVKPFGFSGKYDFNARSREALRYSFGLTAEQIIESIRKELCHE